MEEVDTTEAVEVVATTEAVEVVATTEAVEVVAATEAVEEVATTEAVKEVEVPSKKRGQCSCSGCTASDCKVCKTCKDMKKYGGQGRLKKKCLLKRCCKVLTSPAPPKGTKQKSPKQRAAKKKQATPSSSSNKRVRSPTNFPIPQPPQRRQRIAAPASDSHSTTGSSSQPGRPVRASKRAGALFQ